MTKGEKLCLIRELYEAGSSIEAIAEATGYKTRTIEQLLPQAGICRMKKIKDFEKEIVTMRQEGKTLKEISDKVGFAVCAISSFLCKVGCNKNRTWSVEEKVEKVDESKIVYAKERVRKKEYEFYKGIRYIVVNDAIVGS